jgi:hypothetical protein
MIKKQIYISKPTDQELIRIAQVKGKKVAEVVRTFIEEGIQKTNDIDYSGRAALQKLVHLKFKGGPKDLSANLDHYLYGGPKK